MNNQIITIFPKTESKRVPIVGKRTLSLVQSFTKIDDDSRDNLISEAQNVLSHCIFPGDNNCITNLAVGYVQSGKTMSFTVLSAMAADNGFRVIIYLTGTKTNLADQTYKRLRKDLFCLEESGDYYKLYKDGIKADRAADVNSVKNFITDSDCTLLFPILKHYNHINELAKLFHDSQIMPLLKDMAILIIDDEADQSSFNTYARKNAGKEDWEQDDYSRTYESINNLKKTFPCHSYVQYTATPQAALLIDNEDILSPKYHTVLTPGKGYTGGKFFFKSKERKYTIEIPDDEVYHYKRNSLADRPKSLDNALMQFLISVAIVVFIQKREKYLSMMIHIDGKRESNEKFERWTNAAIDEWHNLLVSSDSDPAKPYFLQCLSDAYEEISKYVMETPSFEEVYKILKKVILFNKVYLIQGNSDNEVDWDDAKSHILVGADMLNRGFTVEKLSMTYMPRTNKGKSTADTIEQRCRFFGYKEAYSDVIRIFLPQKSIDEFNAYVDHEESLHLALKECHSLEEFRQNAKTMVMSPILRPTRINILTSRIVKNKMVGWRQMRSVDCMEENYQLTLEFLNSFDKNSFTLYHDFGTDVQNHRFVRIPTEDFVDYFRKFKYQDMPNITRKIATIQYLDYLNDSGKMPYVYVFQMSYAATKLRERTLTNGLPGNLQEGRNKSYIGDKEILMNKFGYDDENVICFQLHLLKLKPGISATYNPSPFYNIAIYYPEKLEEGYIAVEGDDEDDDDE
jgi:hypothetical protein